MSAPTKPSLIGVGTVVMYLAWVSLMVWLGLSLNWWWPVETLTPTTAYARGMGQATVTMIGAMLAFMAQGYLVKHGWLFDPYDWWQRWKVIVHSNWARDEHGCWSMDLLEVHCGRSHDNGVAGITIMLLGVGVTCSLLINKEQHAAHHAQGRDRRDQIIDQAKAQITEMLRRAGGIEITLDEDEAETSAPVVKKGVH